MEEEAEELRAGSRIAVLLERVECGTLLVSLTCGRRSFSGVLLESRPRGSVCCVSPSLLKQDDPPSGNCANQVFQYGDTVQSFPGVHSLPASDTFTTKNTEAPPLVPPQGTLPTFPPYFEGAPFPPPIWLRHTYNQWVPQPPPRTIKKTKRRLSRNRGSGSLTVSTIRLRPRQVLCEKCKNTLNAENEDKDASVQTDLTFDIQNLDQMKPEGIECEEIKPKKERKEADPVSPELVPRSPVIKISFSTPQGKGEVVEIPSRVHGSVEPFCSKHIMQNGSGDQSKRDSESIQETNCMETSESGPVASIPKLKLTRPVHSNTDAPPPKIRLKPRWVRDGESGSVYKAELISEQIMFERRKETDSSAFCTHKSTERHFADMSSGSSGEDEDYKGFPHSKSGHGSLTLLMNYRKRNVDSSGLSLCSNDSLDESSKSSSSELASLEMSDFLQCDDVSVSSSSKEGCKIVPPLTVRLHTKCVSKCVTEEGRTFMVGDIVWGKIHGFPWWPASILSISTSQKENGEPSWQEAKVSWFGSLSTSFLSVSKLSSFCEFFNLRFNRKKKGLYRQAITEAALAVEHLAPDIRELLLQCET